jgi:hypothetical protein
MRRCESDDDILNYVRILSNTKSKQLRAALVNGASRGVIKTLCNFCSNSLYNCAIKAHLSKCSGLHKHKGTIRKLATRRVGAEEKRRILANPSTKFLRELVSSVSEAFGTNIRDVVSR